MSLDARRVRTLEGLAPYIERAGGFSGWSLAVSAKHLGPALPWDYEAWARDAVSRAARVLDMGTGGGEVLSRIADGARARFVATEEWATNVPVAHRRLAPLGIDVVHARSVSLPFASATFGVVLNRHEELEPAEVARVLEPGGRVLTQQVGPDNWPELRRYFPRMVEFGDLFVRYTEGFVRAGLKVLEARAHSERVAFAGLGDFVYMLLVAPWTVPDFDPERDIDALLALEDGVLTPDGIVLTEERFVIEAAKP